MALALNEIGFAIDPQNAVTFKNKFTIVFKPTAPQALKSLIAKAERNKRQNVTVSWNSIGEVDLMGYEIERSIGSEAFKAIGKSEPKNTESATYRFYDVATNDNNVAYRIKAIAANGSIRYSNMVELAVQSEIASGNVYPNPNDGKSMVVNLKGIAKGTYTIDVTNCLGQKVYSRSTTLAMGQTSATLAFTNRLPAGNYTLSLFTKADNKAAGTYRFIAK